MNLGQTWRDVFFPEASKIFDSYIKCPFLYKCRSKAESIWQQQQQQTIKDKYNAIVEQMVQLGPKVTGQISKKMLKRVCTAESCQTEIVKLQESISNAYAMAEAPTLRNTKSSPKADTSRQKSQRLPVCPLSLKIGLSGKIPPPAKIRLINKKSLLIPTKIASS